MEEMKSFSILQDYNPEDNPEMNSYYFNVDEYKTPVNQIVSNNNVEIEGNEREVELNNIETDEIELQNITKRLLYIISIHLIILILLSIATNLALNKNLNFENVMMISGMYNLLVSVFVLSLCLSYKITVYFTKKIKNMNY